MADQKNAQSQKRSGKKSDKKPADGGAKAGRSSKRRSANYRLRGHKAASVRRHLAAQKKRQERAHRFGRSPKGEMRELRRVSVNLATGAERNLAEVERSLKPAREEPTEGPTLDLAKLFGFGEPA